MIEDAARKKTDAELRRLEREIHKAYKKAYAELDSKWKAALKTAATREKPYREELDAAMKSGDAARIRKAKRDLAHVQQECTLQNKHFKRARDSIAKQLARIDRAAYDLANGRLPNIYALNFNALAGGLPTGYAYGLITPETVRNLAIKQLNLVKAAHWNVEEMNRAVLQGILQGESMDAIAVRFRDVLGMNQSSAIRNARTAVTYAENQGRLDSYEKAQANGVVMVKVWASTHDSRTRESHVLLDGEEVGIDEKFSNGLKCPGDPDGIGAEVCNCRCAMGTRIIGFKRKDGSIERV